MLAPADSLEAGVRAAAYFERYQLQRTVQDAEYRLWAIGGGFLVGLVILLVLRLWGPGSRGGPGPGNQR